MHQTGQERYRLYSYREVEMQIEIQDREEEKGGGREDKRERTDRPMKDIEKEERRRKVKQKESKR